MSNGGGWSAFGTRVRSPQIMKPKAGENLKPFAIFKQIPGNFSVFTPTSLND